MANTANNLGLTTDFNVTPYYDDYDEAKQFYRILYRPGYAVQARELTQMQTILQRQIERFGRHVFEEGTIVVPGSFQLYAANTKSSPGPLNYVKVKDVDDSNNTVDITNFNDVEVTGQTSGVKGFINIVIDGSESSTNKKTIYVDYLQASNANSQIVKFIAGETLTSNIGNLKVVDTDATGFGSAFRITSGIVFSKGHFIWFPTQEVVLDRYNDTPTCKVGFNIAESIVNSSTDNSLLDPALESSNYSAPGADRFKLDAELQVREINDPEDLPDFTTLFTIENGIIQILNERTQYSLINDEWAKRTFDESGDYYVSGLNIDIREHLDNGLNGGVYTSAQGGNANLISVRVESGDAYVKGYRVATEATTPLTTLRSTTYSNVENQSASAFLGSYVTIDEMVGHLPLDTGVEVRLYDTQQNRLSNATFTAAQTGNLIGTARVASIEYNTGTLGTADGKLDMYLMDIRMNGTNSFSTVRSVYIDNASTADFGADIVLDPITNSTVLYEPFNVPLLYYTGSNHTRKIKGVLETSDTTYNYTTTLPVTITGGNFSVSAPGSDSLPYSGVLSTSSKRDILLSLNSALNVATAITVTNNGTTLVGTNFTKLNAGDMLKFSGLADTTANIYSIVSIANATHLVVNKVPAVPLSGNSLFKHYGNGDYIDLTTLGFDSGTVRTVTAAGTTLTFALNETAIAGSAVVSFKAKKTTAVEAAKTLRPSRYVQINCSTAGTSGPFNLGFSDVYRIKQIRKKSTSNFSSNTEGTLVTNQFIFDNGQRDTHYDIARIDPIAGLTATDRLLVELDYFIPDYSQGKGYFTVDSYPVNDVTASSTTITTAEIPIYKSPTSGKSYDLRNHLDFRPIKSISATDSTTVAGASVNPATSTTFNYSGTGITLISPSTEVIYDYSYYLGRKDVVHVNKDKIFSITRGVPAATPVTPQISDNEMVLAVLNISPYPSISPYYAKLIGRQDIATTTRWIAPIRQTMRDIGIMKDRITNLEYYTSLSLLEKNALDLLISDASGNDRFKNGIFVDTFTDHQLGATYNDDYRIVVDPQEKSIRPLYSMQPINYDYLSGTNIRKTGDIVTLDYTEVPFANILSVTSTLNTEKSNYKFIGNLTLAPAQDVWIDTNDAIPPNVISINGANLDGMEDAQQSGGITTTWNSWQTNITGYKVYAGDDASSTLVGTFSSAAEANRVAQNIRTSASGATIETITTSSRTGTEYFNYLDSDSTSVGSRVINTEIVPYIRAQTLMGKATGLKPFAKYFVFFDSINMTEYVRPITEAEYNNVAAVSSWTNAVGTDVIANSNGEIWFRLNLPNTDNLRFTVGQKKLLITDSPTSSDFATSFASTSFFAQGLIQTKQDTILSTRQVENRQKTVSELTVGSTFSSLPPLPEEPEYEAPIPDPPDNGQVCLAYVMPIKAPDNEEGLFLTSVEVFFAEKHPTLGVWFELREVDAGGGITLNQVPFSEKRYTNSLVPISTNGKTNGMTVTFDTPVFLYSNKSYAFIVHPEAGNPNYYLWCSRIGEIDVNTGKQVTSRAYTGSTFTTNNNVIWNLVDQVDIVCNWKRASFVSSGNFEIGNRPKEKLYIQNVVGSIEGFGEPISSGDRLTLSGYGGATIAVTDLIVGGTSGINASVVNINSGTYSMSNIRYTVGETVTVRYASNATSKGTATIATRETGKGFLEYYKESSNSTYVILDSSNGKFFANDSIFDISDEGSATISRIGNFRYSLIDFEPAIINFAKATQSFEMATYSNTGTAQAYVNIDTGENYEFSTEMAVYSRSNEIASLSSNRSNKVRVNMNSSSNYLTPVFDIGRTQSIIVDNIVNSNTVNETNESGGNLFNKYISKIVTLAEGQDAEDLKVYLTAYRPPNTDVKVWIKILNGEDSDTMAQKSWIELEKSFGGDISYSSLVDKKDFKEYIFNIPSSYMTGTLGEVRYTNTQSILFTGYKSFQIKIGLLATNSAIIPRVADLRAIGLQI
jgi:hypothetical protein